MIIKTQPDEIQNYLTDASNFKGNCDAVYFPATSEEISDILIDANKNKTPVTIAGNRTGLAGGSVPQDGIVISTEKLNKIIEINEKEFYAVLEPGVILTDFQSELRENNLLYPPDPTEKNCFIGGTVATNASGEKTFKYGPTRNFVLELEIILADGNKLFLSRNDTKADNYFLNLKSQSSIKYEIEVPDIKMPGTKNASGFYCKKDMDAIDLFIGSEGTLGVITKIKVKLVPYPDDILSSVIFFNDEKDALSFIKSAREISYDTRVQKDSNSIDALALEFFDENSLNFLKEDNSRIPPDAKAAVWFEQEIKSNEEIILEKWISLINEFKGDEESAWFAISDSDKKNIIQFRHSLPEKVNEYISKNNMRKLGTDVAVPHDKFEELYFYSKNEAEKENLSYVIFGHFGNSHMHLNMLPKNHNEYETGKSIYKKICNKAIELKGTVSAEHGIGKIKTEYLLEMYGEENMKKMFNLKKRLDPNLILGRGNIFSRSVFY
ncbi:MAG: FAD-binding oxidoreductase [Ignavibacteriaceae bacterium]